MPAWGQRDAKEPATKIQYTQPPLCPEPEHSPRSRFPRRVAGCWERGSPPKTACGQSRRAGRAGLPPPEAIPGPLSPCGNWVRGSMDTGEPKQYKSYSTGWLPPETAIGVARIAKGIGSSRVKHRPCESENPRMRSCRPRPVWWFLLISQPLFMGGVPGFSGWIQTTFGGAPTPLFINRG